jgi:hypothetical protein
MAERENKTIIFVETKRGVDELTRTLRRDGYEPTHPLSFTHTHPLSLTHTHTLSRLPTQLACHVHAW